MLEKGTRREELAHHADASDHNVQVVRVAEVARVDERRTPGGIAGVELQVAPAARSDQNRLDVNAVVVR